MAYEVLTAFSLEGESYRPGQVVEKLPAGSLKPALRMNRIRELSKKEETARQAEAKPAAAAAKKPSAAKSIK